MALSKDLYRFELTDDKRRQLLQKVKTLHVVFEVGTERFDARNCTGVAIDENAVSGNVVFTRPGGMSPESYDLAQISKFRRLRSRKWLVKLG